MAFSYFRSIRVDHTKVSGSQTNFPVLVSFTNATFRDITNGGSVQSEDGYDVVFFSNSFLTSPLDFEMESYDPATGEVIAWVKISSLSHVTDTVFYVAYGNPEITSDQGNPNAVWDANFKGVWHLGNGATLNPSDSTSNGNNGTVVGSLSAVAGQVDGAAGDFSNSDYIELANLPISGSGSFTLSAWAKFSSFADRRTILALGAAPPNLGAVFMRGEPSGSLGIDLTGYTGPRSNTTMSTGVWYYVAATYESGSCKLYVDGAFDDSGSMSPNITAGDNKSIGNDAYGHPMAGAIDEVRVSDVARSAGWIATEYNNQSDPLSFFALGSEQDTGGISPSIFGVMSAPIEMPFTYEAPSSDGLDILNPLTAIHLMHSGTGDIPYDTTGITWMKIATTKMFRTDESKIFWMRFHESSGNPLIAIYADADDAGNDDDRLAECVLTDDTPGVYRFVDVGDAYTVWGWVYTRAGVTMTSSNPFQMKKSDSQFGLSAESWVPGAEVCVPFQFYIAGPTTAPTINFHVSFERESLPNDPISLGAFEFSLRDETSEHGLVMANIIIKCVDIDLDEDLLSFRVYMEVRPGDQALSQIVDIQPQQIQNVVSSENEVLFVSITQEANDGGNVQLASFDLYDLKAEFVPAP